MKARRNHARCRLNDLCYCSGWVSFWVLGANKYCLSCESSPLYILSCPFSLVVLDTCPASYPDQSPHTGSLPPKFSPLSLPPVLYTSLETTRPSLPCLKNCHLCCRENCHQPKAFHPIYCYEACKPTT